MNAKFLVKITLATSLAFATVTSPIFVAPKTITAQSLVPYNALGLIGNNNSNTIVYGQPSSNSNIIGTLVTNSTVTIIAKSASWYQILYANTTGYVPIQYINETPKPVALNTTGKVVDIDSLNVRKAPHYLSAAINALPKNQTVQITGVTELWYEVVISGIKGYVNRQYIVITTDTPSISEELETPPAIENNPSDEPSISYPEETDDTYEDLDGTEDDSDFNNPLDEIFDGIENDYADFDSDGNLENTLDDFTDSTLEDSFNEFENDYTDLDFDENFDENLDETDSNNTDLDFNENVENDLSFMEDEFEEEPTNMAYNSDQPIPVDKVWSVYFNNEIDASSVNTSTVTLYNSANEKIDIDLNVVGDTMLVSPNANYENDSYILIIKNVQSANGKTMKKPLHYYFTVSQ